MNAIMIPRAIKVTGTATAACIPGEHMPVHVFASETPAKLPVAEAAAAEVKEVLNVDPVGDIIEFADGDPVRVFDASSVEVVCDVEVWAVEPDKPGDLVDVVLPAVADLEGLVVPVSAGPVVASWLVAADDVTESRLWVGVVKNVCVAKKDDMPAGGVFSGA